MEKQDDDPNFSKTIQSIRKEYDCPQFTLDQCLKDPFDQFRSWFSDALKNETQEPNAMCISTANKDGFPSARMVLLKELDNKGFIFFTHYKSKKGSALEENPKAA